MTIFFKKSSNHGLSRRSVLSFHPFEFLLKLVLPDVIELAQAIDLAQSELGFPKIVQSRLAVVLRNILVLGRH